MTKLSNDILTELGWKKEGNKWIHEHGTMIYINKMPETLKGLVYIMTGTAYKMGKNSTKDV